jgi:prolyl oligopeptidase
MELCDKYLHDMIKINPITNDFFSFPQYENKKHIQPYIYSESQYKKLHDLDIKYKKILNKKKERSQYDEILLRDINHNIHMETEYEIYMYMPINLNDNILIEYVTECSGNGTYNFSNRNDFLNFMKRLKSLNEITNEILNKMKNGIKEKVLLPKRTVDRMIENITYVFKNRSYDNKMNYKPKEWNDYVDKYLVKNLEKLQQFLIKEYYPLILTEHIGLCSYKGGKNAYKNIIKYYTFKGITPEIIFNFGISELKRLNKEKKRLEKSLKILDIDKEIKKHVFSDKKEVFNNLKRIREKLYSNIYPKYFHVKDIDKYEIKPVPPENKRMFAYYVPGDLDNKKKGAFYINVNNPNSINKYELFVLSLHEGVPGHHLQLTLQNKSDKPDYLKFGDTTYAEGWGLYCENLGDFEDSFEYYYKLEYEILRSIRLVLDTGIHYFDWDYQKCFDFYKKHLKNHNDEQIDKAILRYMNDPGQAITYKIGEKVFLYVRNKLLSDGYSIKDIHDIMLELGPCPIEMLLNIIDK